ncbi:hypothetical protein [Microbacterium sp. XT11]|uniref:hypothetical protein n=1 Tax=Microbacterium sp. XT11 TaxID=367477 RepID=UPI0008368E84|nr:hypothetical protein [Microbacterium sp. XT11]
MNRKYQPLFLLAASIWLLTACAAEGSTDDVSELTWQEAKAEAQAMELRIASMIPSSVILSIDQHEKGGLFRCNDTQHTWTGTTIVTLTAGTSAEPLVKTVESKFRERGDFSVSTRRDIADAYEVQIASTSTAEGYIVGEGTPGTIWIDSWSPCFTLPDGVYPGGDF